MITHFSNEVKEIYNGKKARRICGAGKEDQRGGEDATVYKGHAMVDNQVVFGRRQCAGYSGGLEQNDNDGVAGA